jgi:membrane protein
VSSGRGRAGRSRLPALLRHGQAATSHRIDHWLDSHLVRRLRRADAINQGLLVAGVLLLCFVPFLLVLEAFAGRNAAAGFVERFGLSREAAHDVRQALTPPTPPSASIDWLSWVVFVVFGVAAAGAIQDLYRRVFGVHERSHMNVLRRAIWLAAALGLCFLGAWTQPWLDRVGGPGLVALAALPGATMFFWWSMWILLPGPLGWRHLFPSALATGICWFGMVIFFRLTLSSMIESNYQKYGPAGVVFAIMALLIAIGVVVILGALLGVAWLERREHPPGGQAEPSRAEPH